MRDGQNPDDVFEASESRCASAFFFLNAGLFLLADKFLFLAYVTNSLLS